MVSHATESSQGPPFSAVHTSIILVCFVHLVQLADDFHLLHQPAIQVVQVFSML